MNSQLFLTNSEVPIVGCTLFAIAFWRMAIYAKRCKRVVRPIELALYVLPISLVAVAAYAFWLFRNARGEVLAERIPVLVPWLIISVMSARYIDEGLVRLRRRLSQK